MKMRSTTRILTRCTILAAVLVFLPVSEIRAAAPPQTLACTVQLLRGGNGPAPSPLPSALPSALPSTAPSPAPSPVPVPSVSPTPIHSPVPQPSTADLGPSAQNPAEGLAKWEILPGQRIELKRTEDGLFMVGGATFPFKTGDYKLRIEAQYSDPTLNPATPRELIQGYAYLDFVADKDSPSRVIAVQPLSSWQISVAQIERNRRPNLRSFEATLINPEPHSFVFGKGRTIWDAFRDRQLPATMAVMAKLFCYAN